MPANAYSSGTNMSTNATEFANANSKLCVFRTAILAGFLLVVPGCKIPALCRATAGAMLPDRFKGADNMNSRQDEFISLENSAQVGYREFFDDPTLTSLMDEALSGNQELKILAEDIRIANLDVMRRSGAYLPFVNLGALVGLDKNSRFSPTGAVEDQLTAAPGRGFPDPLPRFMVAANVSWEIDIWKKLRNSRDAASLRYLGTQEGRNYVVTRMVADVAENYYELLAADNRLMTLDTTISLQEKSLDTATKLMAAGRSNLLPVQRFEAEVRKNQSQKQIIQQQIVEAENRINFIAGRFPQRIDRAIVEYIDLNLHALSAGVPSQQLQNRPDIRQAERELAAVGLDVKVARTRFYPSLILTGGVGMDAFNTRYLFATPGSLIYGMAAELVGPIINRKAIKADYLTANAEQLQAVYNYQRTILNAHIEVVNHLAMVENYGKSIETKKEQLIALEGSVDSATKLNLNGQGEYLDVLLSQRDMMEARMVLIETKQQQLTAVINAYQALGGGSYAGAFAAPREVNVVDTVAPVDVGDEADMGDEVNLGIEAVTGGEAGVNDEAEKNR